MATFQLVQVKSGGGGLEIGDIIQTHNTSLSDGKQLLLLDDSVLDETTYPTLAALLPTRAVKQGLESYSSTASNLGEVFIPDSTGENTYSFQWNDAELYWNDTSLPFSVATIIADNIGAENSIDVCVSENSEYAYLLTRDTAGVNIELLRVEDPQGTPVITPFTNIDAPDASLTPALAYNGYAKIRCSSTGQRVVIVYGQISATDLVQTYESNDYGATFAETNVDTTTYGGISTYNWISISEDLNDFICFERINWVVASYPSFVSRSGTRTNLVIPTDIAATTNLDVQFSGASQERLIMTEYDNAFVGKLKNFWYSDDNGATWLTSTADMEDLLNPRNNASPTATNLSFCGPMMGSKIDVNIVYCMLGVDSVDVGLAGWDTELLVSFHVVTGQMTVLGRRRHNSLSVLAIDHTANKISVTRGLGDSNEFVCIGTSSGSTRQTLTEVNVGKVLARPQSQHEETYGSVPYRIVADAI